MVRGRVERTWVERMRPVSPRLVSPRIARLPARWLAMRMTVGLSRPGFSLAELTVTIVIGGMLCTILAAALTGAQRIARLYGERVAFAEARRVAATILAGEVRYIVPTTDLYAIERDSLALRNFRGTAVVCAVVDEMVLVRYRGLRAPEPAKDSVVAVGGGIVNAGEPGGPAGAAQAGALYASSAAAAGCPLRAGESLYRWTLGSRPEPGVLLLLFESGSYHLTGNAFRYRRGESGRQPLTAELFDDRAGGLSWIVLDEDNDDAQAGAANGADVGFGASAGIGGGAEVGVGALPAAAALELVLTAKPSGRGPTPAVPPATRYWIGIPR